MQIIILAAGKGSRMNADLPKVMHEVGGIPMLERVIRNCIPITQNLVLVYSEHLLPYLDQFADRCHLVNQQQQLGTAHAVAVAQSLFSQDEAIAVVYGDNPMITPSIMEQLFQHLIDTKADIVTLAFDYNQPNQYGKIIIDAQDNFCKIVEAKDATEMEQKIILCNSGMMAFAPGVLAKYIGQCLTHDPLEKKELYLTAIIEVCVAKGGKVSYYKLSDYWPVMGINTQEELLKVNSYLNKS